jgi:hypothetical protein
VARRFIGAEEHKQHGQEKEGDDQESFHRWNLVYGGRLWGQVEKTGCFFIR